MQKKFTFGVLALVGLSGLVALGSSSKYLNAMVESVQTNSITEIFSPRADKKLDNPGLDGANVIPERPLTRDGSTSKPIRPDIPEFVLYDVVFRTDNGFRGKAREQEAAGQIPTAFKYYFKNEAGLTDEEDRILEETALEFHEEVRPLDVEAQKVIDGGNKGAETLALLNTLQEKRNSLVLSNRDKLANRLGEIVFGRFDKYVRENFALRLNSYQAPHIK